MAEGWQVAQRVVGPAIRVLRTLGFRMRVVGLAHLPEGRTVLAPNHYSFLDPPLIGMGIRRPIQYLATHDLWGQHWAFDKLIDAFGAVPLRSNGRPIRALRRSLDHLANEGTVCIFPEGMRVERFGAETARRGAAWLAEKSDAPLVPIYIHGSEWSLSHRHPPFRFIPVELLIGEPIRTSDFGTGREAVMAATGAWEASMQSLYRSTL